MKAKLIAVRGGQCEDCGYRGHPNSLEFHHLDPATKEFTISRYIAQFGYERLIAEAAKCVLLCANCHRIRHMRSDTGTETLPIVDIRRDLKARAIGHMGGHCQGCRRAGPMAVFEFHHVDARTKDFGIGEDGRVRSWELIIAELAKCVMLCANCHREVHAGLRTLEARPGLAETALPYAA